MTDMSRWDADLPGDTPAWWMSRKAHVPNLATAHFGEFITALSEYHGNFSAENLGKLRSATDSFISALSAGKSQQKFSIKKRLYLAGITKKVPDEPTTSNLEIALANLIEHLGGAGAVPKPVPRRYEV